MTLYRIIAERSRQRFNRDAEGLRFGVRRVGATTVDLVGLQFRNFEGTRPRHRLPRFVGFDHDLNALFQRIPEHFLQHEHHERHRVRIVVVQHDRIRRLPLRAGSGVGFDIRCRCCGHAEF